MILINFFSRLNRIPNSQFFITNKVISQPIITFYSIINLFIFYYFFSNKMQGYIFYLLNEFITISFSYFILSGFHVYGITGQICSGKTSACNYLKRKYKATIISIDDLNRIILKEYSVIQQIKKEFGKEVISKENGKETITLYEEIKLSQKILKNEQNMRFLFYLVMN